MNLFHTADWLKRQAFSYGFTAASLGFTILVTEGVGLVYKLTGRKPDGHPEQEKPGIISKLVSVPQKVVQVGIAAYKGTPDIGQLEKELAQWQAEGGEGEKIIEFNGFQYKFTVNPAGRLKMELYRSKLDF